jgi:hypothetical protein
MLETKEVIVPFSGQKLTQIKSGRKEEFCFIGSEVMAVTHHVNMAQALKSSGCILGTDYIVIKKKTHPAVFQELMNLKEHSPLNGFGLNDDSQNNILRISNKAKYTSELIMIYESGFWKLSLNSKLSNGKELRNWLATEVLPSIRKTGSYSLPTSVTSTLLLENSKREVQLQNSKAVNAKNFGEGGQLACIDYNRQNCLQVTGQTPSQLKKAYGRPNKSSKEILREYDPAKAMTMSLNDHLVEKEKMELKNLVVLDDLLTKTFQEMLNIGIRIIP